MKYIVQGNYSKFKVTLTQKSGELIQPYIPTATDEVKISLRGARVYEYKEYEQAENVLTFSDNGCLRVGMYELEVRIIDSEQHRLRCMYRKQVMVVASNDDIPTDASFETDDVELRGRFDIASSVEITIDDELSLTSVNPVQNRVVTAAINGKADKVAVEAPANTTAATLPITALTAEAGKYYRIDVAVETLAITLPDMTDSTKIASVVLYLTGGTTPAVTIASTAPSGGTAPDVYYQDGFAIDAGKTYEVNCLWNGAAWVVAAVEIVIS